MNFVVVFIDKQLVLRQLPLCLRLLPRKVDDYKRYDNNQDYHRGEDPYYNPVIINYV